MKDPRLPLDQKDYPGEHIKGPLPKPELGAPVLIYCDDIGDLLQRWRVRGDVHPGEPAVDGSRSDTDQLYLVAEKLLACVRELDRRSRRREATTHAPESGFEKIRAGRGRRGGRSPYDPGRVRAPHRPGSPLALQDLLFGGLVWAVFVLLTVLWLRAFVFEVSA